MVPSYDPDLTVYDDVDRVLLNENVGSQGPKKLIPASSQPKNKPDPTTVTNDDEEINVDSQPLTVLGPEDVSRTLSELNEAASLPNCSAITVNEVNFEKKNFFVSIFCQKNQQFKVNSLKVFCVNLECRLSTDK